MVKLVMHFRSYADQVGSQLGVIRQEARDYLSDEGVSDEFASELAQQCLKDWAAYSWLTASLDGRVKGTAGATNMRKNVSVLSAALACRCCNDAFWMMQALEDSNSKEGFCDLLVAFNHGTRELPIGLNALSGVANLMRHAEVAEIAIKSLRISRRLAVADDLQTAAGLAERATALLASVSRRQSVIASASRSVDHDRITAAYDRLKHSLESRNIASRIAGIVGCTAASVRSVLDKSRQDWRTSVKK